MYARGNDGLRRKRRRSGMNIRETMEQWERQNLSPYASLSSETLGVTGRNRSAISALPIQRDRDRILHSKSSAPERQDPGFSSPRKGTTTGRD